MLYVYKPWRKELTDLFSILTHLVRVDACNSSCKIIYLRVTLFIMPNYLFPLYTKLFDDANLFVRDIHFPLFSLYNQMFVMFNILFVVCYYLFDIFNF